jgi:ATP-dependent helicase/nuclease subunit A
MARHRQEKKLLDEEMRILYVALTRAEHRLLLVGAPSKKARSEWISGGGKRAIAARSALDWIGPWLAKQCPSFVEQNAGTATDWTWLWHNSIAPFEPENRSSVKMLENISPGQLAELKARLDWKYPFAAATEQEAKSSATALRRALADEPELARPIIRGPRRAKETIAANQLGQAAHRLLQHAQFASFESSGALSNEVARLRQASILSEEEARAVDLDAILKFWQTPFGRELLRRSDHIERELAFTAKFSCADLRAVGAPFQAEFGNDEFIVVQGAADLVAVLDEELWLVDFKTDRVPEQLLDARVQEYSLQLRIYALALSRIYRRPVTRACLHFLEHGRSEWIEL